MANFFERFATGSLFRRGRDAAADAFATADEQLHQMFTARPEPGVWMPPDGGDFVQQHPTRIPPASRKAIRQLPTIRVTPEDLVEEANRECCICLEENHLKDRVTRLPCAHIYHPHCILDWLSKNCTCPVCRYELETDDANYEQHRRERMQHRKPRFASYELQRMSPKALRELASRLQITLQPGLLEKKELIAAIVASEKIDVIAAPEPVEYPLSLLRAMSIRELKRTMEDAGVFFDPIDVVEKDDMVRIFVISGRLVLIPEEEEETVTREDEVTTADVAAQKPNALGVQDEQDRKPKSSNRRTPVLVETVTEGDSDEEPSEGTTATFSSSFVVDRDHPFMEPNDSMMDNNETVDSNSATRDPSQEEEEAVPQSPPSMEPQQVTSENVDSEGTPEVAAEERSTSEEEPSSPMYNEDVVMEDVFGITPDSSPLQQQQQPPQGITTPTVAAPTAQRAPRFHKRTISELRDVANDMHVDLSGCIERSEMVGRLDMAQRSMVEEFSTWNVTNLRAMARETKVDLSQYTDEETAEMAQKLVDAAAADSDGGTHDSHVATYLSALAPLSSLSVWELRGVAREWHVNVSDCLEKGEMIHRLVVSGGPHSNYV